MLQQDETALAYFEAAYAITRRSDYKISEGIVLHNIGLVYDDLGDRDRAREFYEGALKVFKETNFSQGEEETLSKISNMG